MNVRQELIYFCFRLSPALLLCVALGSQGAPHPNVLTPNQQTRPRREGLEARSAFLDFFNEVARNSEIQSAVGYSRSLPLPANETTKYGDGRNCFTGQEPWTPAEAAGMKKIWYKYYKFAENEKAMFQLYELRPGPGSSRKCQSGSCYLNGGTWTHTCGTPAFADGKTCALGLVPPALNKKERWRVLVAREDQDQAQAQFGRNCKAGKCYVDGKRNAAICGSHGTSARPSAMLLAAFVGLAIILIPINSSAAQT